MVDGIGKGSSLARDAIMAAIKKQSDLSGGIQSAAKSLQNAQGVAGAAGTEGAQPVGFAAELREGLAAVQAEMTTTESLPADLLTGKVNDFHEVAVQLKKSDLSFRFALQVRNKLIDAYREVMRMNV